MSRPPADDPRVHAVQARLSGAELAEVQAALAAENAGRDVPIGIGTKARLLLMAWARERRPATRKRR